MCHHEFSNMQKNFPPLFCFQKVVNKVEIFQKWTRRLCYNSPKLTEKKDENLELMKETLIKLGGEMNGVEIKNVGDNYRGVFATRNIKVYKLFIFIN